MLIHPISLSRIDFANASDIDLEHLAAICELSKAGRDRENIFHEEIRTKAATLENDRFLPRFDVERSGLLDYIRPSLPECRHDKSIRVELSSLTVLGESSSPSFPSDT